MSGEEVSVVCARQLLLKSEPRLSGNGDLTRIREKSGENTSLVTVKVDNKKKKKKNKQKKNKQRQNKTKHNQKKNPKQTTQQQTNKTDKKQNKNKQPQTKQTTKTTTTTTKTKKKKKKKNKKKKTHGLWQLYRLCTGSAMGHNRQWDGYSVTLVGYARLILAAAGHLVPTRQVRIACFSRGHGDKTKS